MAVDRSTASVAAMVGAADAPETVLVRSRLAPPAAVAGGATATSNPLTRAAAVSPVTQAERDERKKRDEKRTTEPPQRPKGRTKQRKNEVVRGTYKGRTGV